MNYHTFLSTIDNLGYTINKDDTFTYNRDGKRIKSFYIVEKDSGLSFANIDARRDENFKSFQELRYNFSGEIVYRGYFIEF